MAFAHGKLATFKVHDSSATLRDLSAYINDIGFPRDVEMADTTTFKTSGTAKTYIPGLTDSTISIQGLFDSTADGYLAGLVGFATALTFEYGPAGLTSGLIKYSGVCFLTSYEVSSAVSDAVAASASFQVSGEITRGTW